MALSTNYRRNKGREDNAIANRMEKAQVLSQELGCSLQAASAVVLGRMTKEEAAAIAADLQAAPKRTRGGAGRGQGRKPIKQGEETVTVSLRMTVSQRAKLKRLGGGWWFRTQIDDAVDPLVVPSGFSI